MTTTHDITGTGQSLAERLAASEQLFAETGRYKGLENLSLKEKDHFRYERVWAELRGAMVSARETALHISASPIVRNIGELCFGLYTPEGDSVVVSTGIMVHIHTMSEGIKFMIRNGYEEAGIKPGDIFCNNDPTLGNVHTTDVHTLIPVFHDGKLIAWVGGVAHQVDIGAGTPGHDPVASANRFEDGFYVTCEKIGTDDQLHHDWQIKASRSVRTPGYWALDEKCRIAGCYIVAEALERMIAAEGLDYMQTFMDESVEEGRQIFMARIKERLVPGKYRAASFIDAPMADKAWHPESRVDILMHAPMELTIGGDGSFSMSMEGCSGTVNAPFNASEGSMQGAMWVLLTQTLIYDGRVNDGAYLAAKSHFPPGTWANAQDPSLAYGTPWYFLIPSYHGLLRLFSRGYFCRGFREEIVAGYGFTGDPLQGGGLLADGKTYFPVSNFELCSVGLGARGTMDGLDAAYAMWNPEADMGDAEVWEAMEAGLLYLSRRYKPDTAGYGKYRGGSGWEALRYIHGVAGVQLYSFREGRAFHAGAGLFGGYPNSADYKVWMHNTNMPELVAAGQPYPLGEFEPSNSEIERLVTGDVVRYNEGLMFPTPFSNGDLFLSMFSGGPGYGDPLERNAESLTADIERHVFLPETARRAFGVVVTESADGTWAVDQEATDAERRRIREQRAARSVTFEEFRAAEKQKLTSGNLHPAVALMYRQSVGMSESWGSEFRSYWDLPADWSV
jgi:N-methylhydantoinase B/oxoprolinase/acetone carboxylase alpha subunit